MVNITHEKEAAHPKVMAELPKTNRQRLHPKEAYHKRIHPQAILYSSNMCYCKKKPQKKSTKSI